MRQGELFLSVCGTLKDTSTSDVDLTVSTSTEVTGQTPTKTCNHCDVELNDSNWYEGFQKNRRYMCKPCTRAYQIPIERARNLIKKIKKGALAKFDAVKEGDVYIITNTAWPDWVKIGKAILAEDRLKDYQTYSPFRNYKLEHSVFFSDRAEAEREAHVMAELIGEKKNEWFNITVKQAKDIINGL